MICKKCGTEFDGAFCPKCGERAEACPVCGKEGEKGENFNSKSSYVFEGQAPAQKPRAKITFDKEALLNGVRKFYRTALNIGKVFFSLLLFLILASPIMLHEGINTAGSGYTNAFNLYVDGRFTAVCAILMIIAFYSLIYAVFRCVRYFVFHNGKEGKLDRTVYFVLNLAAFVLCCIDCSGAGDWFADAGAGLSFGIFVGLVGMALSVLRYLFEDKFVNSDGSQTVEVSDDVKAVEKKATKGVGLGTAVVTGVLIVAVGIMCIVQVFYTNPFSSASYGFAETRGDVIKQFGMPENAKEDSSSYTYYSTEYAAAERMIDALIDAQDKQLTGGFESDSDSFDEDDLESMFDGAMGIDGIIEKLEEKQDNIKYKKSVVTFNNDGGDNRSEDTVKSYVCEVITPEVEGKEKEERTLKKLLYAGTIDRITNIANVTYFAKYDDGSFIRNSVEFVAGDEDNKFNDMLGEYSIDTTDLQKFSSTLIGDSCYLKYDTLYVTGNISHEIDYQNSSLIKKIFIADGVTSIESDAFSNFINVNEIAGGKDLTFVGKDAFSATKYYKDDANWKDGVLYIEDNCVLGIKDNVEELTVKCVLAEGAATGNTSLKKVVFGEYVTNIEDFAFEGCSSLESVTFGENSQLTSIGDHAFYNCSTLASITIPDGVTSIGDSAFSGCSALINITIPSSITSIGEYAFYGCGSIEAVYITDVAAWCNISFESFYTNPLNNGAKLYLNNALVTNFVVPDSVTRIGDYAFVYCSSLTDITIPDSVTSIGGYAFYGCSSLTSVTISESVTSIGGYAFNGCKIAKANIPAFAISLISKSDLKDVIINSGESIVEYAFSGCTLLTSITIPDSATSIGNSAFNGCSSLTSVTFGENSKLESIGSCAFMYCSLLTSITIPESVTSIGDWAFYNCSSLTSISIPRSVTSIGEYAFDGCNSIEAVYITDIEAWCNISFDASFINPLNYGAKLYLNNALVTNLVIPDSVTSIGSDAFSGCSSLTSVTFGENSELESICDYAFAYCNSLTSVKFSKNSKLESIGSYAFYDCSSLTSITIPDSATSIGNSAFSGCSSLTSVTISESVTSIGDNAFNGCKIAKANIPAFAISHISKSDLKDVIINSGESIGEYAFSGCTLLTSILILSSVTSIDSHLFSGCSLLTSITIPYSVKSIGDHAFRDCFSLTNITIPSSVTSIGEEAFRGCSSLTSITIPESVTSIGSYAFSGCSSLTIYCEVASKQSDWSSNWTYSNCPVVWDCNNNEVTNDGYIYYVAENGVRYALKNGNATVARQSKGLSGDIKLPSSINYKGNDYAVTSIPAYAFNTCSSLTSVTIPDSVMSIDYGAFYGCSSLTSITIPSSVTSIGDYAFSGCSSLTSITIPDSVTSIGYRVFYNCSSLTSITIPSSVTSIGDYAFSGCSSLTSVTFGDSSQLESIGREAFYNCSSLTSITIPYSVTSIGKDAFYKCSSLTSIIFKNTQGWWFSGVHIPSSVLADPAKAAEYLMENNDSFDWKRG